MMTTIYFVRHASNENPGGLVPGRIPGYNLSPEGKEKAKRLGEFFKNKRIKHIYTSPLERAYETANIIGGYLSKATIHHSYDLVEVDSIHWQAYKVEELFTNNYYEAFLNDPQTSEVPENLTQLAERLERFTLEVCRKHKGEEVICVSHLDPILALKLSLEGKPLTMVRSYEFSPGSVIQVRFDRQCNLIRSNIINPPP